MYVIIRMSKPIECTDTKSEPYVNYELLMIMVHQYKFISCNNYTTLVGVVDSWEILHVFEGTAWGGGEEISVLAAPFCCESKAAFRK